MQYDQCKGCVYMAWLVGLGQGIRCGNRKNWGNEEGPQITSVKDCKYYEAKVEDVSKV